MRERYGSAKVENYQGQSVTKLLHSLLVTGDCKRFHGADRQSLSRVGGSLANPTGLTSRPKEIKMRVFLQKG
jgi:hypothetical protein